MKTSTCLVALMCFMNSQALLSERLWSDFFPEKQLHGLINVTDKDDMFYWLFPSRSNPDNDPLIIWLTGGPGCSSEMAVFYENGPMRLEYGKPVKNEISWNNRANLLFLDNPIGTGYSKGSVFNMPRNEEKVSEYFGIFIQKLYEKYPEFKGRDLYLTGESYAGHYIPFIGDYLTKDDSYTSLGINLKGVAIGNGWVNPKNQYSGYSPFAYDNKLVNIVGKYALDAAFGICKILVQFNVPIVNQLYCNMVTQSVLGIPMAPRFNIYDIRKKCDNPPLCYDFSPLDEFLNRKDVQEELGVPGRAWQSCNMVVHFALFFDFEVDAAPKVTNLLNRGLNVLIYNGDKDYICNWVGSHIWVNKLQWNKSEQFQKTQIKKVAHGEHQTFENFSFYRIYDAGHMVPMDQPEAGLEMLNHFIGAE